MKILAAKTVAVLSIFSLVACAQIKSEKVAQSEINTSYTASYDEGAKKLNFQARFQVGDGTGATQVRLTGKSRVLVNGSEMSETSDIVKQIAYQYSIGGVSSDHIEDSYEIDYYDNDGKEYVNNIQIPKRITAAFPDSFKKDIGFDISWELKDRLASNERVYANLNFDNGFATQDDHSASVSTGKISVTPDSLRDRTTQRVEAFVCRSKTFSSVNTPSAGGSMSAEYCTPKTNVPMN